MFSSGLVLEGGGLRAAYESGVTDAFIENNITFPYVIGVSAGSCNGVSFIAKNLHRMRDIMVNYAHDEVLNLFLKTVNILIQSGFSANSLMKCFRSIMMNLKTVKLNFAWLQAIPKRGKPNTFTLPISEKDVR